MRPLHTEWKREQEHYLQTFVFIHFHGCYTLVASVDVLCLASFQHGVCASGGVEFDDCTRLGLSPTYSKPCNTHRQDSERVINTDGTLNMTLFILISAAAIPSFYRKILNLYEMEPH